jgi:hypothetical protein
MRNSFWACLIAIAVGGISLLVKAALPEQPWLAPALFYLAIVIALLAALGLAHDMGLLSRLAAKTRLSRQVHAGTHPADGKTAANAAARVQVPRPAGPAGPVPVLQKQPKSVAGDTAADVRSKNPKGPLNVE